MGYEGEIWFGNPSQKMQVVFDTGSACAWLYSEDCGDNCPEHNERYLSEKSKDFKEIDKSE